MNALDELSIFLLVRSTVNKSFALPGEIIDERDD
jgi:hypothetical protein